MDNITEQLAHALAPFVDLLEEDHPGVTFTLDVSADDVTRARQAYAAYNNARLLREKYPNPIHRWWKTWVSKE